MLDLRRSRMGPAARVAPMSLRPALRKLRTVVRARGLNRHDVLVVSYPKSGNTWLRFVLVDLALQGKDVDFQNVKTLSAPLGTHREAPKLVDGRGRLIKTHESVEAFGRLPARALYVVRDGRDVAISLFHYMRRRGAYDGPFDDYFDAFLTGHVNLYGTWQRHVAEWHRAAAARPDDIAVVRYEDLLSPEAPVVLQRALATIGWSVPVESVAVSLERNNFENMRKKEVSAAPRRSGNARLNKDVPLVRKGTAGQWREMFSEAQVREFNAGAGDSLRLAGYEV